MFAAHKDHEFRMPRELGDPNTTHWRAIHLSTGAAWYVLTARVQDVKLDGSKSHHLRQTFLLSWDTDVVDALKSFGDDVFELLCVAQDQGRRRSAWVTHKIVEVWCALDPEGNPSIVFVCDTGAVFSGPLAEPCADHRKTELVARLKSPAKHH